MEARRVARAKGPHRSLPAGRSWPDRAGSRPPAEVARFTGAQPISDGRRTDQVREQDRDGLANPAGGCWRKEGGAALRAEAGGAGEPGTACGTSGHLANECRRLPSGPLLLHGIARRGCPPAIGTIRGMSAPPATRYETVIGIEVHAQLECASHGPDPDLAGLPWSGLPR